MGPDAFLQGCHTAHLGVDGYLSPHRQTDRRAPPSPHVQLLRAVRTATLPDSRDRPAIRSNGGEARRSARGNPFGGGEGADPEIPAKPVIPPNGVSRRTSGTTCPGSAGTRIPRKVFGISRKKGRCPRTGGTDHHGHRPFGSSRY